MLTTQTIDRLLTLKVTRSKGSEKVCPQKGCGYRVRADGDAEAAAD